MASKAALELIIALRDEATKGIDGIGGALRGLAGVSAIAGGALAALGAAGIAAFVPFQEKMNEVFTLMPDMSQQAMAAMTDDVKAFAREMGVLPNEAIPALYQAISAGVPADNVFDFLTTAQKAAVGGVTDLETAVDGISSVVNAYGADVLGAAEASDLMFTAVRLGKTDFTQLSASLFNVVPVASSLGVEFGDVTAALAALTSQGVPTSVATTQMRQALVELSTSGGKAATTFESLAGMPFRQFIAEGNNVADALNLMEAHARATGVGVNDLFGSVEAGGAALALTGKGAEVFAANIEAMGGSAGATEAAYQRMEQSLSRSFDKIKAAGAVFLVEVGERLAPVLAVAADYIVTVLIPALSDRLMPVLDEAGRWLTELAQTLQILGQYLIAVATDGDVLNDFLGALPAGMQPVVQAIGQFIVKAQEIGAVVMAFVSEHAEAFKAALLAIGALLVGASVAGAISSTAATIAALANPITLIVAAVAALAAAWTADWGGIRTTLTQWWETTGRPIFDQLVAWLQVNIPAAIAALTGFWQTTLLPALQAVWAFIQEALVPALADVVTWLATNVPPAIQTAADFWNTVLWPALQAVWEFIGNSVIPAISDIVTWLGTNVPAAVQTASDLWNEVFLPALQAVADWIEAHWAPVGEAITGALETVKGWLSGDWASVTALVTGPVQSAKDGVSGILGLMQQDWRAALEAKLTEVRTKYPEIGAFVDSAMTGIQQSVSYVLQDAQAWFTRVTSGIRAWVEENWPLIQATIDTVMAAIGAVVGTVLALISTLWVQHGEDDKSFIQRLWDSVSSIIETAINNVLSILKAVMLLIQGDWQGAWDEVKAIGQRTWNMIAGLVETWKETVLTLINLLLSNIKTAWERNWNTAKETLNNFVTGVLRVLQGAIDDLKRIWQDGLNAAMSKALELFISIAGFVGNRLQGVLNDFAGVASTVSGAVDGIAGAARSALDALQSLANRILSMPRMPDIGGAIGGVADTVGGALGGLLGRASGGPVWAGHAYMVGERGPELFVPRRSGQIVPNEQLGAQTVINNYITVPQPIGNINDLRETLAVLQMAVT